jgi:hypothetical protein
MCQLWIRHQLLQLLTPRKLTKQPILTSEPWLRRCIDSLIMTSVLSLTELQLSYMNNLTLHTSISKELVELEKHSFIEHYMQMQLAKG